MSDSNSILEKIDERKSNLLVCIGMTHEDFHNYRPLRSAWFTILS